MMDQIECTGKKWHSRSKKDEFPEAWCGPESYTEGILKAGPGLGLLEKKKDSPFEGRSRVR